MSKLIPISDSQMKKLGIVKTKNGFLMREQQIQKIVEEKKIKRQERESKENNGNGKVQKEIKNEVKFQRQPQVQQVQVVQKLTKQEVKAREEARGIY